MCHQPHKGKNEEGRYLITQGIHKCQKSRAVVFKLEFISESPAGFLKNQVVRPYLKSF